MIKKLKYQPPKFKRTKIKMSFLKRSFNELGGVEGYFLAIKALYY